jgi:hypothetical protein
VVHNASVRLASRFVVRPLILACAVAACVAAPGVAAMAQTPTGVEHIVSYDVGITIQRDGSLEVTERIDYDFGVSEHHGIFRDIPALFRHDGRYDRVYPVDVVSVTASSGTPAGYKVSNSGGDVEIKIGDPDRTVSGEHTYTISYRVRGALNGFSDHDELYWNATGNQWAVPIDQVTVRVTAPTGPVRTACFAGSIGSRLACDRTDVQGSTAGFQQGELDPYQGVTVVVGFPAGAVRPPPQPILRERWSLGRAFSVTPLTGGVGGLLLLLAIIGFGRLAWVQGRDRRAKGSQVDVAYGTGGAEQAVPLLEKGTFPVEFAPPQDIRPGQVGTLVDETANTLDVTATIVDLAVRKYLRIEEIPKHGLFGKPDWRLVQLREPDDALLEYEQKLIQGVFEFPEEEPTEPGPAGGGLAAVKLSSLRQKFAPRLADVEDALYRDAVARKWFVGRPDKVRQKWRLRGRILLVAGIGLTWLLARRTHLGLLGVPVIVAGLILAVEAHLMPRRTPVGTGLVRRVFGFRTYIETAEKDQSRFAEKENLFYQYLPYAVVFGCTEKWARAFAGLAGQPPPDGWYVGTQPFTMAALVSSIDDFTVNTAGTIASTPSGSGSSGFGGGGFSGGGGGGGGGGSW